MPTNIQYASNMKLHIGGPQPLTRSPWLGLALSGSDDRKFHRSPERPSSQMGFLCIRNTQGPKMFGHQMLPSTFFNGYAGPCRTQILYLEFHFRAKSRTNTRRSVREAIHMRWTYNSSWLHTLWSIDTTNHFLNPR